MGRKGASTTARVPGERGGAGDSEQSGVPSRGIRCSSTFSGRVAHPDTYSAGRTGNRLLYYDVINETRLTYRLIIEADRPTIPLDASSGIRWCTLGGLSGYEPMMGTRPLLDALRRQPGRHDDRLLEALARVVALVHEPVIASLFLLEGNTSADRQVEQMQVEDLDFPALANALGHAKRGRYRLRGPYLFLFPRLIVRLYAPLEVDGNPPAVGFVQSVSVRAESASEAKAALTDWLGEAGGRVDDWGPINVMHSAWSADAHLQLEAVAQISAGGRIYFGS
jgi:hypothetical protein